MDSFWKSLSRGARIGLITGAAFIVVMTAMVGYWLLHTEYQVLFSDLSPQDASAMTAELERLKIPYTVGADGGTLLVEKNEVHKTRIKLMGKDIPLHGAVGFELFNNSDFGMTEFAQKVNYQRALQGEIARTILSLSEIRDVRVNLVLPEQGLFKQNGAKAKAAITLMLKQGQSLRQEQITGIQRLVSAAVPGIATQDVTLVDQHGVALTKANGPEGDAEVAFGRLDLKKDTENYLSRKVGEVLERTFGQGQALASVDVSLDMDRVQSTTEDVLPAPARSGSTPSGVVVREREVMRESGSPLGAKPLDSVNGRGASSQRETEYAVGRRVEQVMSQPGSVRRIQVVAIVRKSLDANQIEQVRALVAATAGVSIERGDVVVVQSLNDLNLAGARTPRHSALEEVGAVDVSQGAPVSPAQGSVMGKAPSTSALGGLILLAVLSVGGTIWLLRRQRSYENRHTLSDAQRQAALSQVQGWMRGEKGRQAMEDGL